MTAKHDLALIKVSKRYGPTVAVDSIQHNFQPSSYTCLLGPSGCGKSSTLRMIAGHESVTEGRILLSGRDISALPPAQRGTAMMFQNYALFPHLSVLDNVAFSLKMKGVDGKECSLKAGEMLELVDLTALTDRLPDQLSGGQRQRAVIARALASKAEFILLDEPLVGIDRDARNSLLKLLDGLCHNEGKTILMVSHDLAAIRQTAHRMIFLEESIRFDGDTEDFPDLVELADLRGIGPVHGHAHATHKEEE